MQVLRHPGSKHFTAARFARSFRRHVGLKLSHVLLVAALLAATYLATESYSQEAGYLMPPPVAADVDG